MSGALAFERDLEYLADGVADDWAASHGESLIRCVDDGCGYSWYTTAAAEDPCPECGGDTEFDD